ncbi:MAG: ABC transporter ATP-binding protein [Chloroflexi bacterium]|nr:MAG: ABC transporter ATP-binding protein [Chloroflexota bacterium]
MTTTTTTQNSSSAEFTLPRRQSTDRSGPVRWIFSHARHHWWLWIVVLIGAFANAALAAVVPLLTGDAFDAILQQPPQTQVLVSIALLIAGTQFLRGILQFARNFGAELMAQRIERDIRDELYISLLGKSMTFHSLQPVGDTMARATNDVREVNFFFSPGINLVIGSANFLIMPLIFAPRYHPSLVIVPALFIVAYFIALWFYLRELEPITNASRKAFGALNTRLAEALDGIETVKGTAQESCEVERFDKNARRFRDVFVRQGDVEARFLPLLFLGISDAAGLLQAIYLFSIGLLSIGDVVGYFILLQMFGFPTFVSLRAYSQISLGVAGARRIIELMNRENNLDQNVRGHSVPISGEVEFKDVCFEYDVEGEEQKEPAVEGISFRVKPGQTVAIVGQTGSGKTTLVKLINRTYDVDQGRVLVDGVDVCDWNLEALRRGISIIEQDIFLFSRSIADNISFGKPGATREEIEQAARDAQAHEFIQTFAEGYDTVIGERGVTLSGGQRQRLALARAFLTSPSILILDDSTSSIDSATEDLIQRAIYKAARGRTTFIITHRLSQIRWADLILVLRQGRLAAVGTHNDLMETSEAYRRIFTEERTSDSDGHNRF